MADDIANGATALLKEYIKHNSSRQTVLEQCANKTVRIQNLNRVIEDSKLDLAQEERQYKELKTREKFLSDKMSKLRREIEKKGKLRVTLPSQVPILKALVRDYGLSCVFFTRSEAIHELMTAMPTRLNCKLYLAQQAPQAN